MANRDRVADEAMERLLDGVSAFIGALSRAEFDLLVAGARPPEHAGRSGGRGMEVEG